MVPVGDGMTGVAAANIYRKCTKARQQSQLKQEVQKENDLKTKQLEDLSKKIEKQGVKNPEEVANSMCKEAKNLKQNVTDKEPQLLKAEPRYYKDRDPNGHVNGHTSVTMMDKDGNQSTGYSRRLADANETPRFEPGTSRLELDNPNVQPVMRRPLNACAEHMAYQNILNPIITYAIQIKHGVVQCIERCPNCEQFDLGNVITDSMNGTPVPFPLTEVPASGSYIGAVISGTILISVADRRKEERE